MRFQERGDTADTNFKPQLVRKDTTEPTNRKEYDRDDRESFVVVVTVSDYRDETTSSSTGTASVILSTLDASSQQ